MYDFQYLRKGTKTVGAVARNSTHIMEEVENIPWQYTIRSSSSLENYHRQHLLSITVSTASAFLPVLVTLAKRREALITAEKCNARIQIRLQIGLVKDSVGTCTSFFVFWSCSLRAVAMIICTDLFKIDSKWIVIPCWTYLTCALQGQVALIYHIICTLGLHS